MIISSLCEFYEKVLVPKGEVLPEGYSRLTTHYQISLTPDGKIENVFSLAYKVFENEGAAAGKNVKAKTVYLKRSGTENHNRR